MALQRFSGGEGLGTSRLGKLGRVAFAKAEVTDERGTTVCRASGTFRLLSS